MGQPPYMPNYGFPPQPQAPQPGYPQPQPQYQPQQPPMPQPQQQPQYAPQPQQQPQYAPQPGYPQPQMGMPGMNGQPLFQNPFDARSVDPDSGFDSLPTGDYKVTIFGHEVKKTNDGTGFYLQLFMRVIEGQYANRELQWKLNLWNASERSVKISYSQLSALGHVTGVFNINRAEDFYNRPFIAIVVVEGTWSNVKGVKYLNGEKPGKAGQGVASGAPPAGAGQPPMTQPPQQYAAHGAPAPQYGPPAIPAQAPNAAPPAAGNYPPQPGQPYQVAPMPQQPPQQTMWPAGAPQPAGAGQQPALPANAPWGAGQPQQPQQPQYQPQPQAPAPPPVWRG